MRLSAVEGDPGYEPYLKLGDRCEKVRVLLEGVEHKNVLTADTDMGFIEVYEIDDSGNIRWDRQSGEAFRKHLYGHVVIRID